MKKIITSLMIILMVVGAMTACSQNNSDNNNDGKKLCVLFSPNTIGLNKMCIRDSPCPAIGLIIK